MTPRFAWPTYKDQWDCRVTQFNLDGRDAHDDVDSDHLRLMTAGRSWSGAEVTIVSSTDEATPAGLTELSAHVLIACPTTQLRRAHPMTARSGESGFEATISIPRTFVAQKASIAVEFMATHDGRRRLVAAGVPWALVVDEAEAPRPAGAPPLRSAWVDFASEEAPPDARRSPTGYCYLDLNESPPLLYLNSGIDGFETLIKADTARTERRRHRDLLGSMIARQVAGSLLRAAVDEVSPGDYGAPATGPTTKILQSACEAVAKELPDTDSVDQFYEKVGALNGNPAATATFWAEADLVLDRITGVSDTIVNVCREVKYV